MASHLLEQIALTIIILLVGNLLNFREIKVENILVDAEENAFLCDWGLASHLPNGDHVHDRLQGTCGLILYEAVLQTLLLVKFSGAFHHVLFMGAKKSSC